MLEKLFTICTTHFVNYVFILRLMEDQFFTNNFFVILNFKRQYTNYISGLDMNVHVKVVLCYYCKGNMT
jgi:hypothetical protein